MKVWFRETNLAQVSRMPLENTLRLTSSLRLLKRKRSSKDMVMSSMANWESARKKSRLWQTLSTIWRWETKTTEISSSKVQRVLILRKSRSWKINAELLPKLCSRREESYKSFKKITMMMQEVFKKSEPSLKRFKSKMRPQTWSVIDSSRTLMLRCRRFKDLKTHSRLLIATFNRSRVKASEIPKITTKSSLMLRSRRLTTS